MRISGKVTTTSNVPFGISVQFSSVHTCVPLTVDGRSRSTMSPQTNGVLGATAHPQPNLEAIKQIPLTGPSVTPRPV